MFSDRVFSAEESTAQLYQDIAKPLVVSAVEGYNGKPAMTSHPQRSDCVYVAFNVVLHTSFKLCMFFFTH